MNRPELLDLYKIAIDEYRFEVTLNWQRAQYYLALNAAVLTVATGLLKLADDEWWLFVAALFGVGVQTARVASKAIVQGHEYYRQAVYKKTLIEYLLGRLQRIRGFAHDAANLGIATTRGMAETASILEDPETWIRRKSKPHTVTTAMLNVMRLFTVINAAGIIFSVVLGAAALIERWTG